MKILNLFTLKLSPKPWFHIILLLALPTLSFAQNSDEPLPYDDIYLLQNVQLISSPGQSARLTSIFIDKGVIKGIGSNIKTPYNTQVIDLDSMYVYAGFIDPLSYTGIAAPNDDEKKKKAKDPGNPSFEQAGITPNIEAKNLLSPKEKSIEEMRKNGFAISHVVPRGGMISGQSALILNKDASVDEMLLSNNDALFAQFKSASGVYPATLIGVISRFSELMRQSKDAQAYETKRKTKSLGMERAAYPAEIQALYPAVKKEMPIFFRAEESKNIHRALKLGAKNDVRLVLAEMKNGWKHIDRIKAAKYQVLLSLNLPKLEDEASKKDSTEVKKEEEIDAAKLALIAKQKQIKSQYHEQAAMFEKSNVPFSFAYLKVKSKDIHKNIKAAIKAGLSEEAALAALTTNAATIIGASSYTGTVEKGKMANLVVTDKPLFEEKSAIKYVFVEGTKFDYSETKKAVKIEKSELDKIVGEWAYTMEIPIPQNTGKIIIENQEGSLVLKLSIDAEPDDNEEITDAVYKDGNLSFSFDTETDMGNMNISYDLDINGDVMEGKVIPGAFGTFDVSGKRTSKPE